MIIQCEQCKTKFRLDDSRIKSNGVKVRCAKCRHIFTVMKEEPAPEPQADFGAVFDQTSAFAGATPSIDNFAQKQEEPAPEFHMAQPPEIPAESASLEPVSAASIDFGAFEPSLEESVAAEPAKAEFTPASQDVQPGMSTPTADTFSFATSDVDFGEVDFGSDSAGATVQEPSVSASVESESALSGQPPQVESTEKFDDLFGSPAAPDLSVTGTSEKPDSFDKSFSASEIDFGADLSSAFTQQEKPEQSKGGMEFVFATPPPYDAEPVPPTPVQPVSFDQAPQPEIEPAPVQPVRPEPDMEALPPEVAEEELPPLSIPSRRKRSPLLTFLVFLLVVVAIGALGFYGKDKYKDLYQGLFQKIMPKASQESGKIILRSINSTFVKNSATGSDLLVISGEAVNGFNTPRGALQVKGMVYGAGDQVLASKNAYCGNPLSREQLATMPLEAIETAMANQLGSALTNLEVAPGKAIPFTVVISSVPAGAQNFGVEPAASQSIPEKSK